jgi:hypothetical protein
MDSGGFANDTGDMLTPRPRLWLVMCRILPETAHALTRFCPEVRRLMASPMRALPDLMD